MSSTTRDEEARRMEPQSVLIVDDNPSLLLILSETFRLEGFEVLTAQDGESAIEEARTRQPSLLVLDVGLPGMNGFEICRALRDDPRTTTLPIVLLTARAADADRHWGLDAGADDYLTKPFDPDRLVRTAREILAARESGESRNPLTKLPDLDALARLSRTRRGRGETLVARAIELEPEATTVLRQKYGDLICAHAIRLAGACLKEAMERAGEESRGLGHAGDASYSRFTLVAAPERLDHVLATGLALFRARVRALYDETDRERDGIMLRQPDGTTIRVPLLELRVARAEEFEQSLGEAA